jgi:hypothetical protein
VKRAREHAATVVELVRVLWVLPVVEVGKRRRGPRLLLDTLRRKGGRCQQRDPAARSRLQHAIGWVDAHVPGGPNCYRRVLLEIALDCGAAKEPFHMGFNIGGGPGEVDRSSGRVRQRTLGSSLGRPHPRPGASAPPVGAEPGGTPRRVAASEANGCGVILPTSARQPVRGHAWLGMRGGNPEDYDTCVVL